MMVRRLSLDHAPFGNDQDNSVNKQHLRGRWTARWISFDASFVAYRNKFYLPEAAELYIHVTADSGYRLYLDGEFIASGPERGDMHNFFFDSFHIVLQAGEHTFVALVWHFDDASAPMAVIGQNSGFILAAEGHVSNAINTNRRNWQCIRLNGLGFEPHELIGWHCIGQRLVFDRSSFPDGIEAGLGSGWDSPTENDYGVNRNEWNGTQSTTRFLVPSGLPEQIRTPIPSGRVVYVGKRGNFYAANENRSAEISDIQTMLNDGIFVFSPNTERKILIDLGEYYCGQVEFTTSQGQGSDIVISWAEALYHDPDAGSKGKRNEIHDKYFFGAGDRFLPNGNLVNNFFTLQYRAGRYIELLIRTSEAPLYVTQFKLLESRYPMPFEGEFLSPDMRLNCLIRPCLRTLQMCAHDTYMDCPFYEQLMYVGDTRIQLLLNYVINNDRCLVDKCMTMMAASQQAEGLISSRYPSRELQNIPTFSLIFVAMANDYVKYVNHADVTKLIIPAVIRIFNYFQSHLNCDGLLEAIPGWNFIDWTTDWCQDGQRGTPPDGENGISAVLNLLYLYALGEAVELFTQLGEPELAARFRRYGKALCNCIVRAFFIPESGLFADTLSGNAFSEHAQCLALLSGFLDNELETTVQHNLFDSHAELTNSTVYFSFYYLETCGKYDRYDKFMERMGIFAEINKLDLMTMLESPEPSRSDCHAWSAHPLYHFFATLLGIRPASPGFSSVKISPLSGIPGDIRGRMPHIKGMIEVRTDRNGHVHLSLPPNLPEVEGASWKRKMAPASLSMPYQSTRRIEPVLS